MHGDTGLGKTHLLKATAANLTIENANYSYAAACREHAHTSGDGDGDGAGAGANSAVANGASFGAGDGGGVDGGPGAGMDMGDVPIPVSAHLMDCRELFGTKMSSLLAKLDQVRKFV